MTVKEWAMRVIQALPEDATRDDIIEKLQHLEMESTAKPAAELEQPLPEGGVWDLLEQFTGTVEMPADWASEHDHYLYGTPTRSSPA